jgi:hypothetical protein
METANIGRLPWLALLGLLTSCGPRVGYVTSAASDGEASVLVGDLAVAEGDAVLISRRYCEGYKPMVQRCRSEPVDIARVVHVQDTPQGRYAVVAVPNAVAIRPGDYVSTTF